jgi:hypothetical protein
VREGGVGQVIHVGKRELFDDAVGEVAVEEVLDPGERVGVIGEPFDALGDQRAQRLARLAVGRHEADHTVWSHALRTFTI